MSAIAKYNEYIHGYIILHDIKLANLPEQIKAEGVQLLRKSEFHITLISIKRVAECIDKDNKDKIETEIIKEFEQFAHDNPVNKFEILPEFRFVQRDDRKTVVVMTKVENIKDFFDYLIVKYQTSISHQPTHITLYSLDPDTGLSISSDEDLQNDTKLINIPALRKIERR